MQTIEEFDRHWKFMSGGKLGRPHAAMDLWLPQLHGLVHQLRAGTSADGSGIRSNRATYPTRRKWFGTSRRRYSTCRGHPKIIRQGGSFPGGWQSLWRACLELNGIASRHLRLPHTSADESDLERVKPELERLGLLGSASG